MENGQVFYDHDDKECVIAQRLLEDKWVLLSGPIPAEHGGTCMMPIDENGKIFYTKTELRRKVEEEGWQYVRARLVVEVATISGMLPVGDWNYFKMCGG